ncbi:hypothetical protein [Candidatus Finniella inopinata]|uniref:Uncharacterized protein n=1 Tax=Candidatus Finniella inopinata TaxID=1696036 RepID=A0A4V2DZS7_9PROT|nr:hypothetical protein [Candidatus Finniella inopinata]RZI46097.1 hypothetical protein EQU50_03965 [Candidatus Finniella inopinata]
MMEFLKVTIIQSQNGKKKLDEDVPVFTLPLGSYQELGGFYQRLITQIWSFQQEIREKKALKEKKSIFSCF